jgi:hypothetical protein
VALNKILSLLFNFFTPKQQAEPRKTGLPEIPASPEILVPAIPGFWDIGPHDPVPVEETFQEFIRKSGGEVIADLVSKSPTFKNADFIFKDAGIVLELKEVETEFSTSDPFVVGFDRLNKRLLKENPDWKLTDIGGNLKSYPIWFLTEYMRLSRPHISRILKKANKQIRETKDYFKITNRKGILLFVNDGFTGVDPYLVQATASDLLTSDYSSIDCFIYITVNRYVALENSNVPRLVWWPTYSDHSDDSLVDFVDDLGRKWFRFLDERIGPFTLRDGETPNHDILLGAKSIVLPKSNTIKRNQ